MQICLPVVSPTYHPDFFDIEQILPRPGEGEQGVYVNRKSSIDRKRKVCEETTNSIVLSRNGNWEGDGYLRLKFMLLQDGTRIVP